MKARRPWAWPLVPLYAAAIAVKDALRRVGVLKAKQLRWPVVSVGSISAGGAGKTPVVITLAKMLEERGWEVDVLSRGYGREGHGIEWVAALGDRAAERYGDEPVVIARATGVPVWVGEDRFAVGRQAEGGDESAEKNERSLPRTTPHPLPNDVKGWAGRRAGDAASVANAQKLRRAVHLLDDGFQHRGLARTFDVVLVTKEDVEDALLPAGNRREGLDSLRRADAVVVREEEIDEVKAEVWSWMREGAQMWLVRRKLDFPAPLFVFGAGLRPVAFCAIARPEDFQTALVEAGCGVVETVAFKDHHVYTMRDMEKVMEVARGLNATGFVTTEKDAVKLAAAMREQLEEMGPVMVAGLEAEFEDKEGVVRAIEARLA